MTAPIIGAGQSPFGDDPTGGTSVLDVVIQTLFAVGLTVQSVAMSLDDERAARLFDAVAGIDATIAVVRGRMTELLAEGQGAGGPATAGSAA